MHPDAHLEPSNAHLPPNVQVVVSHASRQIGEWFRMDCWHWRNEFCNSLQCAVGAVRGTVGAYRCALGVSTYTPASHLAHFALFTTSSFMLINHCPRRGINSLLLIFCQGLDFKLCSEVPYLCFLGLISVWCEKCSILSDTCDSSDFWAAFSRPPKYIVELFVHELPV